MAEPYKHIYKVDLNEPLKRFDVGDILASGDEKANSFEVAVCRDGLNVDLAGCAVYGYFIRPNEETMKLDGTVNSNVVCVELSKSCYVYDGAFSFAIKVTGNGITQTVAVFDGLIVRTTSENIIDGDRALYGLEDLLAQIAATEAATNNANTAATSANTAATRANNAASAIGNASASAETLATGQPATVSVNGMHFTFGLPRGEKGDKGDPGTIENVTITSINGLPEALAGKQPVGNYLSATGTAVNAAKLGGKAPEYYLQPRNLLDNSDFTNPVNQRGITTLTPTEHSYTIDRWRMDKEKTFTLNDGSITISGGWLMQFVGTPFDVTKVYTMAACLEDGTIVAENGIPSSNFRGTYFGISSTYVGLIKAGTYKWAALYEGSYTAETLPPYVPKGYAAELAECQRYLVPIGGVPVYGYLWGSGALYVNVPIPANMRVTPSLSKELKVNIAHAGAQKSISGWIISASYPGCLEIKSPSESNGLGTTPAAVSGYIITTSIYASADL